jgi:acyl-CoA thioester hydrolase
VAFSAAPPQDAVTTTHVHRVAFYETDAMGIMHHANYLRLFENARVHWLDEHDQPYLQYMQADLHFAVTHIEADYRRSARFDDRLEVTTWMEWARGASLRMAYVISCDGEVMVSGATEHAAVDGTGRVRRIPKLQRARLRAAATDRDPAP